MHTLINVFTTQAFITVISGVLVFILSQYILEFILKPRRDFLNTYNEVRFSLIFYANKLHNPPIDSNQEETKEINTVIRELSCRLRTNFYNQSIFNKFLKKEFIEKVSSLLMGISNTGSKDSFKDRLNFLKEVNKLLK